MSTILHSTILIKGIFRVSLSFDKLDWLAYRIHLQFAALFHDTTDLNPTHHDPLNVTKTTHSSLKKRPSARMWRHRRAGLPFGIAPFSRARAHASVFGKKKKNQGRPALVYAAVASNSPSHMVSIQFRRPRFKSTNIQRTFRKL